MDRNGHPSPIEGCLLTWLHERGAKSVREITHRFNAKDMLHLLYVLGWVVRVSHGVYRVATPDDPVIPYAETYQIIRDEKAAREQRYAEKHGRVTNWDNVNRSAICKTLREHDRDLADDPERLDRTFISELVGVECDYEAVDIAEFAESASYDHDKEEERDKLAAAILGPLSEEEEHSSKDPDDGGGEI